MSVCGVKVGVFDSGIGGLTVLRECVRLAPEIAYYYWGDNLRAPYGERSAEEIYSFTKEAMEYFCLIGVNAAVIACNTATAVCIDRLRARYPFPVVGMEPAIAPAAQRCKNAVVLATPRTAESARLARLIERYPACRFTVFAAPFLAGAIERRFCRGEELTLSDHLPRGAFDGAVLGCTHYVFLRKEISAFYRAPAFDGNGGAAKRLISLLRKESGFLIGNQNHPCPRAERGGSSTKNVIKREISTVNFVGNAQKLNKSVFYRTFVQ